MQPLQFKPIFQNYLWGGDRLKRLLNKPTGPGTWAESWEIVDHASAQSVVIRGPHIGHSLNQLVREFGPSLVGDATWKQITNPALPEQLFARFPLLLKFLDANLDLSVQVHPNDSQAGQLVPPDMGKSEAWIVLSAARGAQIYAGTKPGVEREQFKRAIEDGSVAELMHVIEPEVGDCLYVPAGTIHAIGAGLLIAEIQEASDTTFRVFDWDRRDAHGKARPLHVDQAMAVADFARGPVAVQTPKRICGHEAELLVCSPYFRIRRWRPKHPLVWESPGHYRILSLVEGSLRLETDQQRWSLAVGGTMLLTASHVDVKLYPSSDCQILEFIPGERDIANEPSPCSSRL